MTISAYAGVDCSSTMSSKHYCFFNDLQSNYACDKFEHRVVSSIISASATL